MASLNVSNKSHRLGNRFIGQKPPPNVIPQLSLIDDYYMKDGTYTNNDKSKYRNATAITVDYFIK